VPASLPLKAAPEPLLHVLLHVPVTRWFGLASIRTATAWGFAAWPPATAAAKSPDPRSLRMRCQRAAAEALAANTRDAAHAAMTSRRQLIHVHQV
jgi:hypothetical protein